MARQSGGLCRLMNTLISLLFFGFGAYMLWLFIGSPDLEQIQDGIGNNLGDIGNFGDFTDVLGNLTGDYGQLFDLDPFLSDNTTSAWPAKGSGLTLEMWNALDETWQDEFDAAIDDWENGEPDALTLQVKEDEVDHSCKPKDGVMKVCNGNYGATGWLGINELMKNGLSGIIQSSVAKMNEFYLLNADKDERQYTMCHEIGHGFGLPHTDENFHNADLGNCLDYTNRPKNNLHPDESNYKRLQSLYGVVGGATEKDTGKNRRLRSQNSEKSVSAIFTPELKAKYDQAISELEQIWRDPHSSNSGWRLLSEHPRGGDFVRNLDEEHILEVHMLYATTKP